MSGEGLTMRVGFVVRVTVALLRRRVPNAILVVLGLDLCWVVLIGMKGEELIS